MKKIIFFAKNLKIGGMEKALVTLLNNIDTNKYEITLALEKNEGELSKQINEKVHIIDYNLSTEKNKIIRKIKNAIKKFRFIIHNFKKYDCAINYATYSTWGSQMALLCSNNNILFIHSDYYNAYDRNIEKIKDFFSSIYLKKFNKIVFVSKQSRENIINIMPELEVKSEVLGNLVDYKNIIAQSKQYEVDIDKNKINLVLVARLEEHSKNISKLIEKINNCNEKDKFNLYIIGTGPDEVSYKKQVKTENIFFLGEIENPYPYINKCDYLILTSKYEGFPVVYNEATVLGTPIITTIPVKDEQIEYDNSSIVKLDKNLENFDDVIKNMEKDRYSIEILKLDFDLVNKGKMSKFYKLI